MFPYVYAAGTGGYIGTSFSVMKKIAFAHGAKAIFYRLRYLREVEFFSRRGSMRCVITGSDS